MFIAVQNTRSTTDISSNYIAGYISTTEGEAEINGQAFIGLFRSLQPIYWSIYYNFKAQVLSASKLCAEQFSNLPV